MRGFVKVGAPETGRIDLVEIPALRLVRLVDRDTIFHKGPDFRFVIQFALAGRYQFRLGGDTLALGFLQQQGADDDGARGRLVSQGGRAGRMMLGFRRDHLSRQRDTIECDGGAGRHVRPFSSFWF